MRNIKEKISIIMPAYNEGDIIEKNISETIKTFDNFKVDYEIIVIDDGSSDNTWEKIQKISQDKRIVKAIRNMKNFGKGRAIKKAFRFAKGDYIVFLDSDIDLHPVQIETFFNIMQLDDADIVIGSKRHPNSIINYSPYRKIISNIYFFFVKLLFGLPIRDTQTGLKLFKYRALKDTLPIITIKAFAYDLELLALAHRLGYKIAEAPIVLDPKRRFDRIGFEHMIQAGWDTLAIFYRMNILKYYDKKKRTR